MNTMVEIIDTGFACLVEKSGTVDAERFVAMLKSDSFDYTILFKIKLEEANR